MPEDLTAPGAAHAAYGLRFRAALIDLCICLGVFLVGGLAAAVLFEEIPAARIAAFIALVAVVVFYEPVMVARYGGTFGHRMKNIRVVQARTQRNLPVWKALARSLVKQAFGLFSFAFMFVTHKAQSLHDLAAGSEVRIRDPRLATGSDYFVPFRASDSPATSRVRRLAVVGLYIIILFLLTSVAGTLWVSPACLAWDQCDRAENQTLSILGAAWPLGSGILIVLGWTGRLPGCRRPRKSVK